MLPTPPGPVTVPPGKEVEVPKDGIVVLNVPIASTSVPEPEVEVVPVVVVAFVLPEVPLEVPEFVAFVDVLLPV